MKSNQLRSIRFGLLLGYPLLEKWQHEVIRNLIEGGAQFVVLVHCGGLVESDKRRISRLKRFPWNQLFFKAWHKYIYKPAAKELSSIDEMLALNTVSIEPQNSSYFVKFLDEDVQSLREFECDFFLQFWMGIIQGRVLEIARHGIWSFHHGDETQYRGTPPGFWEIYNRESVTGAILQQLTNNLDKGIILKKGYFPTVLHSWNHQTENLLMQTVKWPALCALGLVNGSLEKRESQSKAKIYKPPKNLTFLIFVSKLIINRIAFHLHNIFKAEDWNIGLYPGTKSVVSEKDYQRNVSDSMQTRRGEVKIWNGAKSINWFSKIDKDRFVADPFVFLIKDNWWMFFEDFSYKTGKGVISAIQLKDFGSFPYEVKRVLELPYHLSYPYIFEFKNKIYCMPECHAAGRVQLFEVDQDTLQMTPGPVLIEGRELVDTTLWHDGTRWWMFAGEKPYQSTALYIWYADSPLGPWIEHSSNPVKQDICSSRPAGNLYVEGGKLIRPSQDCSGHYGKRITLNHVTELSPLVYREEYYSAIEPQTNWEFNKGIHTWQYSDQFTIFDAKRFSFIPDATRWAVNRLLKRKIKMDYD